MAGIEIIPVDPDTIFSVTKGELAEINNESRQAGFCHTLDRDEIERQPDNLRIRVWGPLLHANYLGQTNVRLDVVLGHDSRMIEMTVAAWERIQQSGGQA